MKFYIEITLLSGSDISLNYLREKVFMQVHLGLADTKLSNGLSAIGVAFPEYQSEKFDLGNKIRLFAEEAATLESFNAKKRLNRLKDYIHLSTIRNVPNNISNYVIFKRKQSKSNIERLIRRKAKHASIELEQARTLLKDCEERYVNAPFINIKSISSGHQFRIFIIQERSTTQVNNGFNCYGLSATSSIPDF
jgi:CRISPR-associated endonuclease Csy4